MKKNAKWIFITAVILAVLVFVFWKSIAPIDVETIKITKTDMIRDFKETSIIGSKEVKSIAPAYSDEVLFVIDKGTKVKKGDLILKLGINSLELEKSELETKIRALQGQKDMTNSGMYSKSQKNGADEFYDNQVASLQVVLDDINDKLNHSEVYADNDGVVISVNTSKGEVSNPLVPAVLISGLNDLYAECAVLSSDVKALKLGQKVSIIEKTGTETKTYEGKIHEMASCANTSISSLGLKEQRVNVKVVSKKFDNIMLGADVDIVFETMHLKDKISIPKSAVFKSDGKSFVWQVKSGKLDVTEVELGLDTDYEYEVLSGINDGDIIVSDVDNDELKTGKRVNM